MRVGTEEAALQHETSIDNDMMGTGSGAQPRLSSISMATRAKIRSGHALAPDVQSECESVAESMRVPLLDPARLSGNAANMTDSYCNLLRDNGAPLVQSPSPSTPSPRTFIQC